MAIKVESTTDTAADVTAATGGLSKAAEAEAEAKSADASAIADEKIEASEASEAEDESEVESKADADDEDSTESEDGKPKKKKGFRKRIDKLNKRVADQQRETEYWREQAMKSQKPSQETKLETKTEPSANGKPAAANFESHEAYTEALADWKYDQREAAREAKNREEAAKSELQKQFENHNKRVESFAKERDDFMEVIHDVDDIKMSMTVRDAILSSENGPALMYELSKNRKEYERINSLPATAAAREIGKLEARLEKAIEAEESSDEPKETKVKTKAPAPIAPVRSKSSSTKSPDDMSFKEFKAWRENGGGA